MTLSRLAYIYVSARRARGEIGLGTAEGIRCTLSTLAVLYGARSVGGLKRRHIEAWLETRGHLKASTRRTQLSQVRRFCTFLVAEGYVAKHPCIGVAQIRQPRTVPRAIDAGAVARLIRACPDARARAIVALQVWCGLRCAEVSRLNVEDFNRRDRLLLLRGKGGHEREVPVPTEAERYVDAYLLDHPATTGPMFRSYRKQNARLHAETISDFVGDWMRDAGVKLVGGDGRGAHSLRHTAASDVLDRCGDLRVVQQMLGHRDLSTTSVYLRRADMPKMREAMNGRAYRE